ncbi:unnamed protein product [Auanema sp. JU1783]|nr:unnamed protein product [Auanema sp. JU1783]
MLKQTVQTIFVRGCEKVSPKILKDIVRVRESALDIRVKDKTHTFPLCVQSRIYVVAFGKASIGMTKVIEESLGSSFTDGIVIAPESMTIVSMKSKIYLAGKNNLPDENSVSSTKKVLEFLKQIDSPDSIVLFLISGGGSALLCSPNKVSLSEKLETIKLMVKQGASIQQLNTIRQHLSEVKGGKLLSKLLKSKVISLILSDIIGDPIDLIASGPTVIPRGNKGNPFLLLQSLSIPVKELPPSVKLQLSSLETEAEAEINNPSNFIVINNELILEEVRTSLTEQGFQSHVVTNKLSGDATERGREFAQLISSNSQNFEETLLKLHSIRIPWGFSKLALVFGGETTVKLKGSGCGGRNQEMVLSCLKHLKSYFSSFCFSFLFMSVGTDGLDGPNNAAGAIITEDDVSKADLDQCENSLNNSDSYNFWKTFNQGLSHVVIGPTGTNVMDVQILLLTVNKA